MIPKVRPPLINHVNVGGQWEHGVCVPPQVDVLTSALLFFRGNGATSHRANPRDFERDRNSEYGNISFDLRRAGEVRKKPSTNARNKSTLTSLRSSVRCDQRRRPTTAPHSDRRRVVQSLMTSTASRFVEFCIAHVAVVIAAAVGDRSIRLQSSTVPQSR